jgi:hypothetical protein
MKCKKHPKYKGMRRPRLADVLDFDDYMKEVVDKGCTCWGVYRRTQYVREGDTIRIQGYDKSLNGKLAKVVDRNGGYVLVKPLHYPRGQYVDLLDVECKKVFK